MNAVDRLRAYYPGFSQETLDVVGEFAERQHTFATHQDFFDAVGVGEPEVWQPDGINPVKIIDIRPKEHDPSEALMVHLTMANPLDANQIFQIATLAGTNPNKRVIAVGNPAGGRYKEGVLTRHDRKSVRQDNLIPLVKPGLEYLERLRDERKITLSQEVGYSYGALKAIIAASVAAFPVSRVVAIEPVVGPRSIIKLASDFSSTDKMLKTYVDATDLDIFNEARKAEGHLSMLSYIRGLLRLSNIAIGQALARTDFLARADYMLHGQRSDLGTTFAWGSASELCDDGLMSEGVDNLTRKYGDRVRSIRLFGQKHALANDLHLQAAIVREGLAA